MYQPNGSVSIPNPRRTYAAVVVVVVVMLVGSLLVPLLFGQPEKAVVASGGASGDLSPGNTFAAGGSTSTTAVGAAAAERASAPPGAVPVTTLPATAAPAIAQQGAAPLTASDVGVTPTSIRVGVVLLDLSTVAPLGLGLNNYDTNTQKEMFNVFFNDVNKRGGLYGRHIDPVYVINDPLTTTDAGAARAQCLELTTDLKVFLVIGYPTDSAACMVGEERTPVISYGTNLQEVYASSRHYLISDDAASERIAREWADALDSLHLLAGKKVGIVAGEVAAEAVPTNALQAELTADGIATTYRSRLSADADTATSELPIEVQRMHDAGVNAVLLPTNFETALLWVQNAQGQGWTPQYYTSDLGGLAADGLVRNAPASFDGAIGLTYAAGGRNPDGSLVPYRPEDEACRTLYNSNTTGKQFAQGDESPLLTICALVDILAPALHGAGPDLTRVGLVSAVQQLTQLHLPLLIDGHFGPGRTDYASGVRPVRWKYSCKCYTNAGGPIPPRG